MNPTTAETTEELKARGAFYTPSEITNFLAEWSVRGASDRALEPSCGDGAFIVATAERFAELGVTDLADRLYGVELEEGEAEKSRKLAPSSTIRASSFFDVMPDDLPEITAVIGNPPYIRYHGFTGEDRKAGLARAAEQGVKLTQLASSWAHFVVHSAAFLPKDGGRIALVLPAELLHTDYAEPVRDFLSARFSSVVVIAFDRNVFDDAQVDAVLLLASNDDAQGLRLIRVHDGAALAALDLRAAAAHQKRAASRRWSSTIDADVEEIYDALKRSGTAKPLSDFGSVDIGVVTGRNAFFILDATTAKAKRLPKKALTPIINRPGDIPGLTVRADETKFLLDLRGKTLPIEGPLKDYLDEGVELGITDGYKAKSRKPWYGVPLPKVKPQAFIPYMNHHAPRLVVNAVDAWSTNLIHGFAPKADAPDVRALSGAMLSALTLLSAEIEGRAYGGGVLKVETKEAERLLVPVLDEAQTAALLAAFDELDALVRDGKVLEASARVDEILDLDHERYVIAYQVFRSRRLGRKLAKKAA